MKHLLAIDALKGFQIVVDVFQVLLLLLDVRQLYETDGALQLDATGLALSFQHVQGQVGLTHGGIGAMMLAGGMVGGSIDLGLLMKGQQVLLLSLLGEVHLMAKGTR